MKPNVLVCSASHDMVNSNAVLRGYVASGFAECLGDEHVRTAPLGSVMTAMDGFSPDLVLVFGSCMPDASDYSAIRTLCDRKGAQLAFWLHDDPYEFDFNYKVIEYANAIFTNDRWAAFHIDHPNVHYLPLAAERSAHYRPIADRFERDYFFCGVGFQNRRQFLRDALPLLDGHAGLICGAEWPSEHGFQNVRIDNGKLPDYYNASLTTINLGRRFNLANRKFGLDAITPGPRTFEAAMAGAVQCFHFETTDILDCFSAGSEILLFDTPAELRDLLDGLSADVSRRNDIARQSQLRCLSDHTYAKRAESILGKMGLRANSLTV